jgi:hypothetical protein
MFPLHHQTMKILGLRVPLSCILLHLPPASHRQKLELNQQAAESLKVLLMPILSMSLMVLKGGVNSACKLLILSCNFIKIKKK